MSLIYRACILGIRIAKQAMAQGHRSSEPTPDHWREFYDALERVEGVRSTPQADMFTDEAFRGAFAGHVEALAGRTWTDDERGLAIKAAFELGANTGLCERFASFTDSELSDLVLWVTTYGMTMANEARVCSYCKSDDCFRLGCRKHRIEGSTVYEAGKPDPLPFPKRGESL